MYQNWTQWCTQFNMFDKDYAFYQHQLDHDWQTHHQTHWSWSLSERTSKLLKMEEDHARQWAPLTPAMKLAIDSVDNEPTKNER